MGTTQRSEAPVFGLTNAEQPTGKYRNLYQVIGNAVKDSLDKQRELGYIGFSKQ